MLYKKGRSPLTRHLIKLISIWQNFLKLYEYEFYYIIYIIIYYYELTPIINWGFFESKTLFQIWRGSRERGGGVLLRLGPDLFAQISEPVGAEDTPCGVDPSQAFTAPWGKFWSLKTSASAPLKFQQGCQKIMAGCRNFLAAPWTNRRLR